METDKHYFLVGVFIIGLTLAAALFATWLVRSGHRDDILYRIYFAESVSGLALGDPVKYHGVDVGAVDALSIDSDDPQRVRVDVQLRKTTPVKTDTRATLKLKGVTGTVYIELEGGSPETAMLVTATPTDQIPEIPAVKSRLASALDELPGLVRKFSSIEDQVKNVMSDVKETTSKVKENPSLLLRRPKEKSEK